MSHSRSMPAPTIVGGLLLAIAFLGFISLGLPDAIAGVAWPSVRDHFTLPQSALGLIFLASGGGNVVSSFFSGRLTHSLGLGQLLVLSSLLVGIAMLGSGMAPLYVVIVAAGVVWGLGSGGIDAGLNTYAAHHFSPRHVSWLHACYSFGAMLGPLIMTACLVQLQSWRMGYALVGIAMLVMTAIFVATRRRWIDDLPEEHQTSQPIVPMLPVLASPLVWIQIAVFYCYTGLEATVGQWSFTLLTESRSISAGPAGVWVAVYFGSLAAGRVVFGFLAEPIGLDRLVRIATFMTLTGCGMLAVRTMPWMAFTGLALAGFGLSPIFPCLMARTPARLKPGFAAHAIGFQVSAATLGAATMPGVAGLSSERWSLEAVAVVAIVLSALLFLLHELLLALPRMKRPSE